MKLTSGEMVLTGLTGYLVLTPVLQYEPYGIDHLYNVKRLLQVALLLAGSGILIFSARNRKDTALFFRDFDRSVRTGLPVFLILGGISCFFATQPDWAFLEYGHILLIIVLTFFIGTFAAENPEKAKMYFTTAVLGYLFFYLCRVGFFYILYQLGEVPLWPGDLNSKALYSFSAVRFFNQTQTWTIPVAACLGWYHWNYSDNMLLKRALPVLIAGWGMLVIASGGRGTILGTVVALFVVWAFLVVRDKWKCLGYGSFLAVSAGVGYYIFFELLAGGTKPTLQRASSSGRLDNWAELFPEIAAKPFLGYGPMHYSSVALDNAWGHAHNWFLQFAYEWGIPAALILLVLFLAGLYCYGRYLKSDITENTYEKEDYWIKVGLLGSLAAAFVHGIFSGLTVMPLSQSWFILAAGVAMGLSRTKKISVPGAPSSQPNTNKLQLVIIFIVLAGWLGLFNWGLKNPVHRKQVDTEFYEETETARAYPRYWQQGRIRIIKKN